MNFFMNSFWKNNVSDDDDDDEKVFMVLYMYAGRMEDKHAYHTMPISECETSSRCEINIQV